MSGKTGFQSWTGNSYQHVPQSSHQPLASSEEMWDEPSSSVKHITRVFHNQSLKNTASDGWDAWDGSYTPNAVNVPLESFNRAGNFGGFDHQHNDTWQSSASGQCPDGFRPPNESLHTGDDSQMRISSRHVGLVIGKGGSRIKELQMSSGAKINVKRNDVDADGMVLVTLEGDMSSRSNAKRMIDELIESDSAYPSAGRTDNFQNRQTSRHFGGGGGGFYDATVLTIASNMIGAVIGRGGQQIREIEEKTQTKVKIGDNRHGVTVEVSISGSEDGRQRAKLLIEDVIQSESETGYTPQSERTDVGGRFAGGQQRLGSGSVGNQHRSGFGDFDHHEATDRSHFVPNSERSGFGGHHSGSQQRSGFDHFEPAERSFGNSGRSSFGSSATQRGFGGASAPINWDQVKELSQQHEEEKWKGYPPIKKNFYIEDAGVSNMEPEEIAAIREENNNIMVSCDEDSEARIPNPVRTFDEGFFHYPEILSELKRAGFTKPSPIQMQGWPIALQGLDLIGIAQTGTGKTLAFLLPAFIHIEGQPVPREKRGGPNVLVLSPTRELALQVSKSSFCSICCGLFLFNIIQYSL